MYIQRTLSSAIKERLFRGKAIILIGARQVGKSTMLNHLVTELGVNAIRLNCDDPQSAAILSSPSDAEIKSLFNPYEAILIDEAQRVKQIGLTLKRIVESFPEKQLLVTGSSAFELHDRLNEPMTGRKFEFTMYPLSTAEIAGMDKGVLTVKDTLQQRLIYGSYPEIFADPYDVREYVLSLAGSYLYKDILMVDEIRKSGLIDKIVKAIALQLGSEVSYNELAQLTGSNPKTVEKYVDLLEKCFVLFRLPSLSRNLRTELKKSRKIYFWDNGIRNAVIQNFAPSELRNDMGALWENFFISERIKHNSNNMRHASYYFWRTTDKQEVDLIEEVDGRLAVYEMKYREGKTVKFPAQLMANYDIAQASVVTPVNFTDFLL